MWGYCYCVQLCLYEVHDEGNITVFSDVFMRYRMRKVLLYTEMWF